MVQNVSRRHRNAILPIIPMHIDTICDFSWIGWYVVSRYILPIRMRFYVHFRRMAYVM